MIVKSLVQPEKELVLPTVVWEDLLLPPAPAYSYSSLWRDTGRELGEQGVLLQEDLSQSGVLAAQETRSKNVSRLEMGRLEEEEGLLHG